MENEVFFLFDEIEEKNRQDLLEITKLLKHPSLQKDTYVLSRFTRALLQASAKKEIPVEYDTKKLESRHFTLPTKPFLPVEKSEMHYAPSIPKAPLRQQIPRLQVPAWPKDIPRPTQEIPKPEIHEEKKEPSEEKYNIIMDSEDNIPLASAVVKFDYNLKEPELYEPDRLLLERLKDVFDGDVKKIQDRERLKHIVEKYSKKLDIPFVPELYSKMKYYLTRDVVNLGKLEPLLRDVNIDKIKCHGPGEPIKVVRKNRELVTDVRFESEKELHDYLVDLLKKTNPKYDMKEKMFDYTFMNLRMHIELGSDMTSSKITVTKKK